MAVAVTCSTCTRGSRVPDSLLGQVVRCPYCFDPFTAEAEPAAVAVVPEVVPADATEEATQTAITGAAVGDYSSEVPLLELADAPAVEVVGDVAPLVAPPVPATPIPFPPIRFVVLITRDPDHMLKGRMVGEVSAAGLRLTRPDGGGEVWAAPGSPARYLGVNRLAITLQGREVQLLLFKAGARQERLAHDVAAFLNGDKTTLNPYDYSPTWHVNTAALLVLGLPLLALLFRLVSDAPSAGIWMCLAAAVAIGGIVLGQKTTWHPGLRFAGAAALTASAYGLLVGALFLGLAPPPPIAQRDWVPFDRRLDERFAVRLPLHLGRLRDEVRTLNNHPYTVHVIDLPRHRTAFSVASINLAAAGVPFQDPGRVFDERKRAIRDELASGEPIDDTPLRYEKEHPGRQLVFKGQSERLRGQLIVRLYLVRHRLFVLTAAGFDLQPDSPTATTFFKSFTADVPPGLAEKKTPRDLPGLVAWFPFDEGEGAWANDQSGRGGRLSLRGPVRWTEGVRGGKALLFNGPGSRLDYDGLPGLDFGDRAPFTLAGWVRTTAPQGTILSQRQFRDSWSMINLSVRNGELVSRVHATGNVGGQPAELRGGLVQDGRWHHFALTRSGDGELHLYADGTLKGRLRTFSSSGAIQTDLRSLGCERYETERLGRRFDDANHFHGSLDEFCVFNRDLTETEIRGLAQP